MYKSGVTDCTFPFTQKPSACESFKLFELNSIFVGQSDIIGMGMNDIQLKLDQSGKGAFVIEENGERLAEMEIRVSGNDLTVYHTEVSEKLKGQGVASKLLAHMVDYVRKNHLKVIALCPYVHVQFTRHEAQYADIWNKTWHNK